MDLNGIIQELLRERERIQAMIQALERADPARLGKTAGPPGRRPHKRRGRKPMNGAERQEVSQRMKLYWEKRKQQASATIDVIRPDAGVIVGD
jgi:hypothetical protein